jgi:hypothetical protein
MNFFRTAFLSLMIVTTLFHSQQSKAATGAIVAAPAAVTAGLYIAGSGLGIYAIGNVLDFTLLRHDDYKGVFGLLSLIAAIPVAVIGLVVLDGEQEVKFGSLTKAEAGKLQFTTSEFQAYNAELDQLNSLASYVDEEVARDGKVSAEESASLWSELKDAVSPEAFTALVKVNAQIYHH